MKYNEYTIPVEQVVDEAPMGLIKQGVTKLASKIPGSIGAKATGALQTGSNANAMYKEFYTYLGQKGLKPTTTSISAFLKTKGVSDALIKQHVGAAAGSGAAKYPQGGGGEAPAQTAAPQPQAEPAAQVAPAPTQAAPQPQAEPAAQVAPAPTQAAPQPQAEPATQKSDWAEKGWRSRQKLAQGVHKVPPPPGTKLAEEIKLQRLLAKISKRL